MNKYKITMASGMQHIAILDMNLLELREAITNKDLLSIDKDIFIQTKHIESVKVM